MFQKEEMGQGERVFQSVLNQVDVGVATMARDGTILYSNPRFAEMFGPLGYQQDVQTNVMDLVTPNSRRDVARALEQALRDKTEADLMMDSVAGTARTIRLSMMPVQLGSGLGIGIIATEVTELMERTKQLLQTEKSVQYLSAHIMRLQDEERRRIARDLHDVTGQELAVIGIGLKQITQNYEKPGFNVRESLEESSELVRKVGDEIRTLSYLLHPPLLDEFGLSPAVRWYCDGFKKRTGIDVEVQGAQDLPRLQADAETALFRVVQECLTNVLRHSGAKKAEVRLTASAEGVQVSVEDHGRGIRKQNGEAGISADAEPMIGVGIRGMQERLQQLKGNLAVQSCGNGTIVTAMLPADPEAWRRTMELRPAPEDGTKRSREPAAQEGCKRVLIVDDHEVVRRGIRALLAREPNLEVCGEAEDGLEAVEKARELNPDVIILDLTMPRAGGLAVARNIQRVSDTKKIKILIFTTHASAELERTARLFHCDGYVLKSNAGQDLVRGIRAVLAGDTFFHSAVVTAKMA